MRERQVAANLKILEAYKEDLRSSNDEVTSSHKLDLICRNVGAIGTFACLRGGEYLVGMFVFISQNVLIS